MTNESFDARLGRLLREERLANEASAPDLARLLEGSRTGSPQRTIGIRRLAFSAAALAIVAAVVVIVWPARPSHPPAIEIADWNAPTDVFLRTSGSELWSTVPDLVSSDVAAESRVAPERTKGVSR